MDSAVIFDVDGVLLELTAAEEDVFFLPFAERRDRLARAKSLGRRHERRRPVFAL